MSNRKRDAAARAAREELADLYRQVYDRCMEGEVKTFDAKGALSALERMEKMKGLEEAPDAASGGVTLTLSDKVGERGD